MNVNKIFINKRRMTGKLRRFTNKIAYIWTANRLREFKVASNDRQYTYNLLLLGICSDFKKRNIFVSNQDTSDFV